MKPNIKKLVESIKELSNSKLKELYNLLENMEDDKLQIEKIISQIEGIEIEKYTINDDLTIDVNGYVYIFYIDLDKLPIKFGIVKGEFKCYSNPNLISLEGSPKKVIGDYYCSHNLKLESLESCPEEVTGYFDCSNNNLESLEGSPKKARYFNCCNNSNLTKEYLNNYDFSFVTGKLYTDYDDINDKWNKK